MTLFTFQENSWGTKILGYASVPAQPQRAVSLTSEGRIEIFSEYSDSEYSEYREIVNILVDDIGILWQLL